MDDQARINLLGQGQAAEAARIKALRQQQIDAMVAAMQGGQGGQGGMGAMPSPMPGVPSLGGMAAPGVPGMSQSQFSGYGTRDPQVEALRQQQLIRLLQQRGQ